MFASSAWRLAITLALVLTAAFALPGAAAADDLAWSPVPLPADGAAGRWVLAAGSDVRHLTAAPDGTLYCYATPTGTTDTLFKSTDGGVTWATTGRVKDAIADIAVVPHDSAVVYYSTTSRIYKSTDAGASFIPLPPSPGGAGAGNIRITSVAVIKSGNGNLVAVGTADADAGQYGGVYLYDEGSMSGAWTDAAVGTCDMLHLAFSPAYDTDRTLVAIATDEANTLVRTRIGGGGWGQTIADAHIAGILPASADVAFPATAGTPSPFYIGLSTGMAGGDVYRIDPAYAPGNSPATDLDAGAKDGLSSIDIAGLSVSGSGAAAILMAGCAGSAEVYTSLDGGAVWTRSRKPPSGDRDTGILILPGTGGGIKAMAVTTGVGSAFSASTDGGKTWDQMSLIDGRISVILDVAVARAGTGAGAQFLLTLDSAAARHSLWRTEDDGAHWQRVFSGGLPGIDTLNQIEVTTGADLAAMLYLAGKSRGNPMLWQSEDLGHTFAPRPAPCEVRAWAFEGNTVFIAGRNGAVGVVHRSVNGGLFYLDGVEVGSPIASLALSPAFVRDGHVLAGDITGRVFLSRDRGASFEQVGQQLPLVAGEASVSVVFDPDFTANQTVYASSDAKVSGTVNRERVFRHVLGSGKPWQGIYGSLPDNAAIGQIQVTATGTLYAVNNQAVASAAGKGGLLRSLEPASGPAFELVVRGLDEGATLDRLWVSGDRLWSTCLGNTLVTMRDALATPPALKSPAQGATGLGVDNRLEWEGKSGATEYEWQIADGVGFASLPAGATGTTASTAASVTGLKPATTYNWRVRATKPVHGPWSQASTFTTMLGGANAAPALDQPAPGARVGTRPIFQWSAVPGADRYELLVSADPAFAAAIMTRAGDAALPANAWLCDSDLEHGATYFWKVRACAATNAGLWSAVSAFTTEPAPAAPTTPTTPLADTVQAPPSTTTPQQVVLIPQPQSQAQQLPPTSVVQFSVPNWALYAGLGMMLAIILLLATVLVLLLFRRQ